MTVNTLQPDRPGRYFHWPLLAGLFFALAALVLAPLLGLQIGSALDPTARAVPWTVLFLGVFLCGWLVWFLLMPGWSRVTPLAGAIAGILVGFMSYPLVLGLAELTTGGGDWTRVIWVTGLSLMTTGLAAVLGMAILGFAMAWLMLAMASPPGARATGPAARSDSAFWRLLRWLAAAVAGLVIVALALSFAYLSLTPVPVEGLRTRPSPTTPAGSHEEAVAAFAQIRRGEAEIALHERCPSQLLTHGRTTRMAVVFFHGLTSCPAQGEELAHRLFSLGYNVYLPRMYGHGEADADTLSLAGLTAEHLVDLTNSAADLAQGLGNEVIIVGLSAGGTMAAWAAQNRADVDHAIPVSPFLGPYIVPTWATGAATKLSLALPNMIFWINPLAPVTAPETGYVFPRPSTHTLAQIMRLGQAVMLDATQRPPSVANISLLLNEADVAVNNALTGQLVDLWRANDHAVTVRSLEFSNHLPHDLINPHEIFGDTDLIYSLLAGMIRGGEP